MSLKTVGYANGRPIRIDEGPAVAEPREWYRGAPIQTASYQSLEERQRAHRLRKRQEKAA